MTPELRQLARTLGGGTAENDALTSLVQVAESPSVSATVRLLHTAACHRRKSMRMAARKHLITRGHEQLIDAVPDDPVDGEDARLLARALSALLDRAHRKRLRWGAGRFRAKLATNANAAAVARTLVWGTFADDAMIQTFSLDETGEPVALDDRALDLQSAEVGLPWAAEIETLEAWREHLVDYLLVPPFPQLYGGGAQAQELDELISKQKITEAVALGRRMNAEELFAALKPFLISDEPAQRADALEMVKACRLAIATDHVAAGLADPDGTVRKRAATAARMLGLSDLLPELARLGMLGNGEAMMAMSNWQGKRGTKVLLANLAHANAQVRAASAKAARYGAKAAMKKILPKLIVDDPDPGVRFQAVLSAAKIGAKVEIEAARSACAPFPVTTAVTEALERLEWAHSRGW